MAHLGQTCPKLLDVAPNNRDDWPDVCQVPLSSAAMAARRRERRTKGFYATFSKGSSDDAPGHSTKKKRSKRPAKMQKLVAPPLPPKAELKQALRMGAVVGVTGEYWPDQPLPVEDQARTFECVVREVRGNDETGIEYGIYCTQDRTCYRLHHNYVGLGASAVACLRIDGPTTRGHRVEPSRKRAKKSSASVAVGQPVAARGAQVLKPELAHRTTISEMKAGRARVPVPTVRGDSAADTLLSTDLYHGLINKEVARKVCTIAHPKKLVLRYNRIPVPLEYFNALFPPKTAEEKRSSLRAFQTTTSLGPSFVETSK